MRPEDFLELFGDPADTQAILPPFALNSSSGTEDLTLSTTSCTMMRGHLASYLESGI